MSGEESSSVWSDVEVTLSAPRCVWWNSVAESVDLSIGFRFPELKLEKEDGRLSRTQAMAIQGRVNIRNDQRVVGFVTQLTYGIRKSSGVRISMLANVAGKAEVIEHDYSPEGQEPLIQPMIDRRLFSAQGLRSSGAGQSGLLGPFVPYRISLIISIERETLSESGGVSLDSIDVFPVIV